MCPECRKRHRAHNGVRTFQQNKYILKNIKDKKAYEKEKLKFEQYQQHERDVTLYCENSDCRQPICSMCLLNEHRTHDVKDILQDQSEKSEAIFSTLEPLSKNLHVIKQKILRTKKDLKTKYIDCPN